MNKKTRALTFEIFSEYNLIYHQVRGVMVIDVGQVCVCVHIYGTDVCVCVCTYMGQLCVCVCIYGTVVCVCVHI
jgi:hypothetical protein